MKRHILVFAFIILFITICTAEAQNSQMGFIGGINIANLEEEETDFSSRTCFGFGGVVEFGLGEKVGLCFEPMYLQKGASEDMTGATAEMQLAYLELPVLFKLYLGSGDTKPYLMAGPTIGFKLSADMEVSYMGMSVSADVSDLMETLDYGLAFGGGVSLPVGNNSLFIEARYALGLADIAKEGDVEIGGEILQVPEAEVKTSGIQIMAGMTFPLN